MSIFTSSCPSLLLTEPCQEFGLHNPQDLILHTSSQSYIVGNKESYDKRQYPAWFDSTARPGVNTKEGQAFGHTLVIARNRIFNIVDPEATANHSAILREMKDHFVDFWNDEGKEKLLRSTRLAVDNRNTVLAGKEESLISYNALVPTVNATFDKMAALYRNLKVEDFVFAFHPFPLCSVGHLHMHILPRDLRLREVSTLRHDWKTVPLEAIEESEKESNEN